MSVFDIETASFNGSSDYLNIQDDLILGAELIEGCFYRNSITMTCNLYLKTFNRVIFIVKLYEKRNEAIVLTIADASFEIRESESISLKSKTGDIDIYPLERLTGCTRIFEYDNIELNTQKDYYMKYAKFMKI
jgi:hypothetical protein